MDLPSEVRGSVDAGAARGTADQRSGGRRGSGRPEGASEGRDEPPRARADRQALDQTTSNVTHAARLLKISRKGLQLKMKELGLRERDERSES